MEYNLSEKCTISSKALHTKASIQMFLKRQIMTVAMKTILGI